jgi:hypothetical protein
MTAAASRIVTFRGLFWTKKLRVISKRVITATIPIVV